MFWKLPQDFPERPALNPGLQELWARQTFRFAAFSSPIFVLFLSSSVLRRRVTDLWASYESVWVLLSSRYWRLTLSVCIKRYFSHSESIRVKFSTSVRKFWELVEAVWCTLYDKMLWVNVFWAVIHYLFVAQIYCSSCMGIWRHNRTATVLYIEIRKLARNVVQPLSPFINYSSPIRMKVASERLRDTVSRSDFYITDLNSWLFSK